jgi:hypothetical protein
MKKRYLIVVVLFTLLSCSRAPEQPSNNAAPTRVASLPDDPCAMLSSARVAEVTGIEIVSANRVPSLDKVVLAQEENREPGPGTICSYQMGSDLGALMIMVPSQTNRTAAKYWEERAKYFETFPGGAHHVEGVGSDAWFSGGTSLRVLTSGNEYFIVATQMVHPRGREIMVNVAKAILDH